MTAFESVAAFHGALRAGTTTVAAELAAERARAEASDAVVGVFIARAGDTAERAAEADERVARGLPLRPLEGVTIGVKDVIRAGLGPTTGQSAAFADGWGEEAEESVATRRLREAGAILVGTTTTMELAYGVPEEGKPFPVPRNPHDPARFPGGSSSGSAAGVAAGFFRAALGTDTGGSIRIPSAMCGVTGFKPGYGAVPRDGVMPLGASLDHVGPIAPTAAICREVFEAIADPDALARARARAPRRAPGTGLAGVRIGVDRLDDEVELIDPDQPQRFDAALRVLRDLGAELIEVRLPRYGAGTAAALLSMMAEASAQWGPLRDARPAELTQATRILLDAGRSIAASDYLAAQRVRAANRRDLAVLFDGVDAIVTPTCHLDAPPMTAVSTLAPTSFLPSVHTGYWSGVGLPSLAVPIGPARRGLPLSLLVNGPEGGELRVLGIAEAYQAAAGPPALPVTVPGVPPDST